MRHITHTSLQAMRFKMRKTLAFCFALILAVLLAGGSGTGFLTAEASSTVPGRVDRQYLFDGLLRLDPFADTSGFSISATKNGQPFELPINNISADARENFWPFCDKNEWAQNRYGFFKDNAGRKVESVSFGFDAPDALKGVVINITYPYIGTYNGEPIGMTLAISNIEFMRTPFSAAVMHEQNSQMWMIEEGNIVGIKEYANNFNVGRYVTGPSMMIAKLPQYGIYQCNIHQDDFSVKFYKTSSDFQSVEGNPLQFDDVFFTYTSLSYIETSLHASRWSATLSGRPAPWPDSWGPNARALKYTQSEKIKALSKISDAFITNESNVYAGEGTGAHGNNERFPVLSEIGPELVLDGKTYWPHQGTLFSGSFEEERVSEEDEDAPWPYYFSTSEEGFVDSLGNSKFTTNSISLKYADTTDIRFRMNSVDNSFWFTIFPVPLTNVVPGEPHVSVDGAPWKNLGTNEGELISKANQEALSQDARVSVGDTVTYRMSQPVNNLGQDAFVRYQNLKMVLTIPDGVTIDPNSLVITRSRTAAEINAGEQQSIQLPNTAGSFAADGQVITYTFSSGYLQNDAPMQGEYYNIEVKGKVDTGTSGQHLEATAKTIFNNPTDENADDTQLSNPGRVVFANQDAVIYVNSDVIQKLPVERDETFYFSVTQRMPDDAISIAFSDKLDDRLEALEARLYVNDVLISEIDNYIDTDINGQMVTAYIKDNISSSAPIDEKYATALRGNNVTLVIKAQIENDVTAEGDIPNTAWVLINDGDVKYSNEVVVVPPPTPTAPPTPVPTPTRVPNTFYFCFTKEWRGTPLEDIAFTVYHPDGTVKQHRFDRTKISETEWLYEAWFFAEADYYVIETPMKGYASTYVNIGEHADVTDRVYNGGKIINASVPKTGDAFIPALWLGLICLGVLGLGTGAVLPAAKRKK